MNAARQPGFDAALTAYYPSLRRQAAFLARGNEDADELLQETIFAMLRRADGCRMETFRTWAQWVLASTHNVMAKSRRRLKRSAPSASIDTPRVDDEGSDMPMVCAALTTLPNQQATAELREVVDRLSRIPNGDIVIRRAMGDLLVEIGAENGTSRENIRQKEARALKALRLRTGRAAA